MGINPLSIKLREYSKYMNTSYQSGKEAGWLKKSSSYISWLSVQLLNQSSLMSKNLQYTHKSYQQVHERISVWQIIDIIYSLLIRDSLAPMGSLSRYMQFDSDCETPNSTCDELTVTVQSTVMLEQLTSVWFNHNCSNIVACIYKIQHLCISVYNNLINYSIKQQWYNSKGVNTSIIL